MIVIAVIFDVVEHLISQAKVFEKCDQSGNPGMHESSNANVTVKEVLVLQNVWASVRNTIKGYNRTIRRLVG